MYSKYVKRLIDFVVSLILLILLFPLLLFISILLVIYNKNTSTFFYQDRPGRNGEIFRIIKFKTMSDEMDKNGKLLPDVKRLTKIGRSVRTTSMDELPQLINVLKGDMSLIGPRPLLIQYLPLYTPEQARRHEVRPGITGWAQTHGRNTISWEKKFELDVWYVDHISFATDFKILILTIKKVVGRKDVNLNNSTTMPTFNGNKQKNERINNCRS